MKINGLPNFSLKLSFWPFEISKVNSKVRIFFVHNTFNHPIFRYRHYLSFLGLCKSYQVSLAFLIPNALRLHSNIAFLGPLLFFNFIRKLYWLARLLSTSFFFLRLFGKYFSARFILRYNDCLERETLSLPLCIFVFVYFFGVFCSHPEMKLKMMVVVFAEQIWKVYFGFPLFFFPYILCSDSVLFKAFFKTKYFSYSLSSFFLSFSVFLSFSFFFLRVPLAVFFIWGTFIFDSFRFTHSSSKKI